MKKLTTILIGLLIAATAFCQMPNTQYLANNATLLVVRGTQRVDSGLVIGNFPDTATANLGPWIKGIPFLRITVGGTSTYMRNATASAWLLLDGPGSVNADMGLSTSSSFVQLGQPVGSLTNPSIITENREIPTGAFPNRNSVSFTTDYSGIGPFPLGKTQFRFGGVIDLIAPNGPGININELDSTNFFGDAFPSLSYTAGYRQLIQVFTGMHWTSSDKHYDIADLRNSMKTAQLQAGGLGLAIWDTSGATFLGWGHSVHRTNLGSCCTIGGQTVNVTGSMSITDSVLIRAMLTGTTSDSALVISGGLIKRVTQASLAVSLSSLTAATTTGGMDNGNFEQIWQWNTLSGTGLHLVTASSAAPTGNGQALFFVQSAGSNSNAGATSRAIVTSNNHTGTTSTNVALWASSTNGTNNYAILVPTGEGSVGIGTITPAKLLQVAGTVRFSALGTAVFDTTTYKPLGISSAGDLIPLTSWPSTGSTGTVTSIATTSPITGGTITTTGTIACATCVVASSPGVGIAHFAGSTQTVTSSAVALGGADVSGILLGANGGTGVANTGFTITLAGNLVTTGAFNTTFAASATATYTLPTATSTLLANNLGLSGNTTLIGGTGSGGTLTLQSTSNATKGKILFGTSGYDEVNNRLGIGNSAPAMPLDVTGAANVSTSLTAGSFQTNSTFLNSNFLTATSNTNASSTTTDFLFGGATTVGFRVAVNGSANSTSGVGWSTAATIFAGSGFTEAGSGTHAIQTNIAVIHPLEVNAGATTTDLTTLYIDGRGLGITPTNQATSLWVDAGIVRIDDTLALGTNAPSAQLHTTGSVRMANFGAGAATFDASGNISSVSDGRLKFIQGNYTAGLKELLQLNPIIYKWRPESGMETEHEYAGLDARQVHSVLGDYGAPMNNNGYYSLADRSLIDLLINAVKELNTEIEQLKKQVKNTR